MSFCKLKVAAVIPFLALAIQPVLLEAAQNKFGDEGACLPRRGNYEEIFDGRTMNGWKGDHALWFVREGILTGYATTPIPKNNYLVHQKVYDNFEVRVRYRFPTKKGNSGLEYRSYVPEEDDSLVKGYEANVVTVDAGKRYGFLYDQNGRGLLASLGERVHLIDADGKAETQVTGIVNQPELVLQSDKPFPEWNELIVLAYGNELVHVVNDHITVQAIDDNMTKRHTKGVFALQLHGGMSVIVEFKDISVKKLASMPDLEGCLAL